MELMRQGGEIVANKPRFWILGFVFSVNSLTFLTKRERGRERERERERGERAKDRYRLPKIQEVNFQSQLGFQCQERVIQSFFFTNA